jgi:nitrilase
MNAFTAAAVQIAPVYLDRDASVEKAAEIIAEAAANGATLVAFPESWLPGYPAWIYGRAGWEDGVSKDIFARLHRNAVEVPGPATDRLCQAARQAKTNVVMGLHEVDHEFTHGTLYNSQLFISDQGEIAGLHRKLMPTHAERIIWGQGDGSGLVVAGMSVGRVGGLICWEHWMPLARYALHAQGEQVHVAAWPDAPEIEQVANRSYAFEGRCYVICAASWLTMGDVPDDFEAPEALSASINPAGGDQGAAILMPGGSSIVAPDGEIIAGPVYNKETILYGEIDLSRIPREYQAMDTAGHYNRPDIFDVRVDRSPRRPITWTGRSAAAAGGSSAAGPAGAEG